MQRCKDCDHPVGPKGACLCTIEHARKWSKIKAIVGIIVVAFWSVYVLLYMQVK